MEQIYKPQFVRRVLGFYLILTGLGFVLGLFKYFFN